MTIDELILFLHEVKAGKKAQSHCGDWHNFDVVSMVKTWSWRIKPEPREWWLGKECLGPAWIEYNTQLLSPQGMKAKGYIHVREVIDP